jgi:hypothetical protein
MNSQSKNRHTISQIAAACRHVRELMAEGVTENHAIRTLELITDYYAKLLGGGPPAPHHVSQVPKSQWSLAARELIAANPDAKPALTLRVEHGTPRRAFARMALDLYDREELSEESMGALVSKFWKLAVITVEEDARLAKTARSRVYPTPDERWAAAEIRF